jgi:hypothetical protein
MKGIALIAACCALGAGATSAASAPALAHCRASQLKLAGSLQGASQSLIGSLTLLNRSDQACGLPAMPRRVSLQIGKKVLSTVTVPMVRGLWPPGAPTRMLPGRAGVNVAIQWRNWCGRPRGNVHLKVGLTIYRSEIRRTSVGLVRTPVCVARRMSSRVAVSGFVAPVP